MEREDGCGLGNVIVAVLDACVFITVCDFAIMLGRRALR